MQLTGPALRLAIFIGENDTRDDEPLHHEIVRRAREAGLGDATVLQGRDGYGTHSPLRTDRILDVTEALP